MKGSFKVFGGSGFWVAFLLSLASFSAQAQTFVQNEALAELGCLAKGTCAASVDSKGKVITTDTFPEESTFNNGDFGNLAFGVTNEFVSTFTSTANGAMIPQGMTKEGQAFTIPFYSVNLDDDYQLAALEDVTITDGEAFVKVAFLNNRTWDAFNSTDSDLTPPAVGDRGAVASMLMYDSSLGGANSAIIPEDTVYGDTGALVMAGAQRTLNLGSIGGGDDDATQLKTDGLNRLYVNTMGDGRNGLLTAVSASDIINTTSTQLIAAGGANVRSHIRDISCSNTSATGSRIDFLDGSTVVWTAYLPAASAGGSYTHSFTSQLSTTANTAFNVQLATTATATRCAATYYQAND